MIRRIIIIPISSALSIIIYPVLGEAQINGPRTKNGCVNIAGRAANISVSGVLSRATYPGPPNYESVARGDRPETIFILTLPQSICIDDGGSFAEASKRFRQVQVEGNTAAMNARLKALIGHTVTIRGAGEAAETGHHHEPLVVSDAELVSP